MSVKKAKALWALKAAKDRSEELYDPARKDNILGRTKTRLTSKTQTLPWKKAFKVLGASPLGTGLWFEASCGKSCGLRWPAVVYVPRFYKRCGKGPFWEGVWPYLHPWDSVHLRTASVYWNVPGKYGPLGELLFLPYQEGAGGGFERRAVESLCVSAETRKACALIGLHLLAAEGEAGSSEAVLKARNGSALARQATPPLAVRYEHNNEFQAIEVVGQDWSSEVVALFLEDWELGRVVLSCHMTMDLLCREMRDACWDSSESLGFPCSLCSQCQKGPLAEESEEWVPGKSTVTANKSLSLTVL